MLLDPTVSLNEKTPVYPGDPQPKIEPAGVLERDGYQDHLIHMGTHLGTHMDAPSHMLPGGKNLDQFMIEKFSGRGVCISVTDGFDMGRIQAVGVREGDTVLFCTGMSNRYHEPSYFIDFADIPEEVAAYLVGKKIGMVGVDMCSVDRPPFPIHKILLGAEVLIIENLTNLKSLVGKEFKIHAYPIKLALDGAPVRVVAELP